MIQRNDLFNTTTAGMDRGIVIKTDCADSYDKGNVAILKRLREELSPAFGQLGRPVNLFSLDASRAAFVIIDMQNFSCAPASGTAIPSIASVISHINSLADSCRSVQIPVIWVRQNITTGPDGNDGGLYPVFHEIERLKILYNKGAGTEIFPGMDFRPSTDHVVFKNRYSAFLANPPELKLRLDVLKRTQLIIAGIAANVCVESTARDAMQLDYEVVVVADAVGTFDKTLLKNTLKNIMLFFGDVRSTKEVMDDLGKSGARKDG